jgi:hypothetical protein
MSTPLARLWPVLVAALMLMAAAAAARAPAPDAALDLRYDMYYGGIRVADVRLRHANGGDRYGAEFDIATKGLVDVFLRYRGQASTEGRLDPAGALQPVAYSARYKRRDATRVTEVRFDETGEVTHLRIEKRGKPQASEVPEAERRAVVDPLTALFALRQHLAERSAERFRARVFDGRRRYDLEASVAGRERASVAGASWPALRLELVVIPLAGFDGEDLVESGVAEGGFRTQVLVSDDERAIPLEVRTLDARITVIFQLRQDCSAGSGCAAAAG